MSASTAKANRAPQRAKSHACSRSAIALLLSHPPGGRLPALAPLQLRDVGEVMAGVPCIEREHPVERLRPALRVLELAVELLGAHRAKQNRPAGVQTVENR